MIERDFIRILAQFTYAERWDWSSSVGRE